METPEQSQEAREVEPGQILYAAGQKYIKTNGGIVEYATDRGVADDAEHD